MKRFIAILLLVIAASLTCAFVEFLLRLPMANDAAKATKTSARQETSSKKAPAAENNHFAQRKEIVDEARQYLVDTAAEVEYLASKTSLPYFEKVGGWEKVFENQKRESSFLCHPYLRAMILGLIKEHGRPVGDDHMEPYWLVVDISQARMFLGSIAQDRLEHMDNEMLAQKLKEWRSEHETALAAAKDYLAMNDE